VKPLREPRDAFAHDVVISMLADDRAVRDALISTDAISQGRVGRIHIVMSTISLAMVDELKALHAQSGVAYIAAPVFGVPAVAATGGLNILAAGPIAAIEQVQPLFDVMGKKTWRLGDDQASANVAKIAGNLMITQAIESMAEATALTEAYGLSAKAFLDIVTQTMFASPSYQRYAQNIATDTYEPGFKLTLGLKDVGLAIEAAQAAGLDLPMSEVVRSSLSIASSAGLGDKDWSALARAARGELTLQSRCPFW
jgi:3-hydroxyisobutyrate dehydrogenase-like beta-hydroxyacid dehydrogenase